MSLNRAEVQRTREELHANFELSGLTIAEATTDLDLTPAAFSAALDSQGDPADTWLVRDYLEQAVIDTGRRPVEFSILTPRNRRKAEHWFALRTAPRHEFAR